ncbi:MAG: Gfo/Idh/MocA family oxidoreductase [Rhizobiales bacterium]|nr:Gfo/Idh/MocA family oxidoreductase [Hyphomicrobiales bacterium]MBI3672211.1 Gfo/Idh/MocA family oxidoreductase [Hyphomicrobiales bacterium]
MHTIRIIGAGSIGNHLAHAARSHGWAVTLTDIDPAALERARTDIYPSRYGAWDEAIVLKDSAAAMADPADVVFIGTPPDSHIAIANAVLDRLTPKALVIEKPLAGPDLAGCAALHARVTKAHIFAGVGYNHSLGQNTVAAEKTLKTGALGPIATISARTREHWGGIFKAHPWLSGPADSYLGFASRGGGAAGEHSHGINIWQHFAHVIGAGRVAEVSAMLDMVTDGGVAYDRLCYLTLATEEGLVGDVIQDVVTAPTEKSCRIQGRDGFVDWRVNHRPGHDAVISGTADTAEETLIAKTRADDFKAEIAHLEDVLAGKVANSPIALARGLDTMMVIAAAFKSHELKRRVRIDWHEGYTPEALI